VGHRAVQASALRLLGLSQPFSPRELRDAYFEFAKQCHPDSSGDQTDTKRFLQLTEAYESLRCVASNHHVELQYDTPSEEEEYRAACQAWLGLQVVPARSVMHSSPFTLSLVALYSTYCSCCSCVVADVLCWQAEQVEESKACPMFRQWLASSNDLNWVSFLALHGGLAARLNPRAQLDT